MERPADELDRRRLVGSSASLDGLSQLRVHPDGDGPGGARRGPATPSAPQPLPGLPSTPVDQGIQHHRDEPATVWPLLGSQRVRRTSLGLWLGTPGGQAVVAVALTGVVLGPLLLVVVTRWGSDWLPLQDFAVIDLRVREVWSPDIPLTGAWSRVGWSHPGPLFYWLLAVPSRLFSFAPWSLFLGGAVLQIGAVVGCARLAWLRGGLPVTALVLAVVSLTFVAVGPRALVEPWNPNVALPYFVLLVLLVWSAAAGDAGALPCAAAVGTFLVQCHIGYLLLVACCALWLAWNLVSGARLPGGRSRSDVVVRQAGWAAAVAVVLWLPTVVDQLFGLGNLGRIVTYFTTTEEEVAGLATGAGLFAASFRVPPPWSGGPDGIDSFTGQAVPASLWWLLVPVFVLVASGVLAVRSGLRQRRQLVVLVVLLSAFAVAGMAQVRGERFAYLFPWRTSVALLTFANAGCLLWSTRLPRWIRRGFGAALGTVVLAASLSAGREVLRFPQEEPFEPVARALVARLEPVAATGGPVLLGSAGTAILGLNSTLVNELDRRGAPVRVSRALVHQFGDHRVADRDEVGSVWVVAEDGWIVSRLSDEGDGRLLARVRSLPDAAEQELVELQVRLGLELEAEGKAHLAPLLDNPLLPFVLPADAGLDPVLVDRTAALNQEARDAAPCRCAVFTFPPDSPVLDEPYLRDLGLSEAGGAGGSEG